MCCNNLNAVNSIDDISKGSNLGMIFSIGTDHSSEPQIFVNTTFIHMPHCILYGVLIEQEN